MPDISSTSATGATSQNLIDAPVGTNPKSVLGKDDFLKLLLTELKYQDPTEPMDSGKILTQTSQLAGLEASKNTNKALDTLASAMQSTLGLTSIGAIGKIADTGSDAISHEEGKESIFEVYFPSDVASGSINITDTDGNIVSTIDVEPNDKGVYQFGWSGLTSAGDIAESGIYSINATYKDPDGVDKETRLGAYPIESVKFENGQTKVKVGSNYIPFESISEIYEG